MSRAPARNAEMYLAEHDNAACCSFPGRYVFGVLPPSKPRIFSALKDLALFVEQLMPTLAIIRMKRVTHKEHEVGCRCV